MLKVKQAKTHPTTTSLRAPETDLMEQYHKAKAQYYELFTRLREQVAAQAERLRRTAGVLGMLDVLCALAEGAAKKGWVRPEVSEGYDIHITEGRHPVVEALAGSFVPNDLQLDEAHSLLLLTGPNAAGKSTYARQAALLVILAQIGSFLPAEAATIGVVDRIFTRVGAADFLARGLSTFMVEMYVAKLAGLPAHVVRRAEELLADWEQEKERAALRTTVKGLVQREHNEGKGNRVNGRPATQAVIERLSGVDPPHTTPMAALLLLAELKKLAEGTGR